MAFFTRRLERILADYHWAVITKLESLEKRMADNEQQNTMSFSDVQAAIVALNNDNIASNNAISAQVGEVSRMIEDFAAKSASGEEVSQSDLQTAVAQLREIDSRVQANTAAIQASTSKVQAADPAPASDPAPVESAGGTDTTNADGSVNLGGTGSATVGE